MHCLYGGYNLHRFSDALGLVIIVFGIVHFVVQFCIIHYIVHPQRPGSIDCGGEFLASNAVRMSVCLVQKQPQPDIQSKLVTSFI